MGVSIHAFRGEGDADCSNGARPQSAFQSTPSGGKATGSGSATSPRRKWFQSTPSGGKATHLPNATHVSLEFQSTPSGGKATKIFEYSSIDEAVSIHAFRGEGDGVGSASSLRQRCFNPRLPGGRRPDGWCATDDWFTFQSTPSGGKATVYQRVYVLNTLVSIHAFRGEGDTRSSPRCDCGLRFQSTPSGGKATAISRAAVPCSRQIL